MSEGCDVNDIMCRLETLRHLRGLKKEIGTEKFQAKYPELVALDEKLTKEIEVEKSGLHNAVSKCDAHLDELIPPEENESEIEPE